MNTSINTSIPRPEYPRPQMVRDAFLNLNGTWDFSFDFSNSGTQRKYWLEENFERTILVPFCPESKLSGIGYTDFIPAVWYKRTFTLPEEAMAGKVYLHFGAVDYHCRVWVNDVECGEHKGGYTSFNFDITRAAHAGENKVVVWAEDDVRSHKQPRGKQSDQLYSHECDYTRTTGIWQTVWVEWTPKTSIASYKLVTDRINGKVDFEIFTDGCCCGAFLKIKATLNGEEVGYIDGRAGAYTKLSMPLSRVELWEPGNPVLYDLTMTLTTASGTDTVTGYFGVRDIEVRRKGVYLNGKPVFQRLVLDQGFYPDGIYTAPTDEDMKIDITRNQELGFNGARLHQKVFEPRFLYWADHLGYLCWGEYPCWGLDFTNYDSLSIMLPEWLESMDRDYNHPAIIGWCPMNETHRQYQFEVVRRLYEMTKRADPTRPAIDTSGYIHTGKTDLYDIHDYEQDPKVYAEHYAHVEDGVCYQSHGDLDRWDGETPIFISEYGGTWWNPKMDENSWGYGQQPKSEEEVCCRYCGVTKVILENSRICAFCYTQPYDIEQEQNGLFYYDRSPKFSEEIYRRIKEANLTVAAIEKEEE